jgi:hypothetical protein
VRIGYVVGVHGRVSHQAVAEQFLVGIERSELHDNVGRRAGSGANRIRKAAISGNCLCCRQTAS